jgi:excisionase family DNA binding protein
VRTTSDTATAPRRPVEASTPMLTKDSVAAYLSISLRTLDRLLQAGAIPSYRIGGHRRFRLEDVEQYIARSAE